MSEHQLNPPDVTRPRAEEVAKQCLRGIRVETIEELETRILQYLAWVNEDPVPFRWRAPETPPEASSDAVS